MKFSLFALIKTGGMLQLPRIYLQLTWFLFHAMVPDAVQISFLPLIFILTSLAGQS